MCTSQWFGEGLTFELSRLRRLAKPAVAGRLQRRVRPRTHRRLLARWPISQRSLEPRHIVPLAKLVANRLEYPNGLEPDITVQRNATLIGQGDAGKGIAIPLEGQLLV